MPFLPPSYFVIMHIMSFRIKILVLIMFLFDSILYDTYSGHLLIFI